MDNVGDIVVCNGCAYCATDNTMHSHANDYEQPVLEMGKVYRIDQVVDVRDEDDNLMYNTIYHLVDVATGNLIDISGIHWVDLKAMDAVKWRKGLLTQEQLFELYCFGEIRTQTNPCGEEQLEYYDNTPVLFT